MYDIKFLKSCRGLIKWKNNLGNNLVYTIDAPNENDNDNNFIDHLFYKTFVNHRLQKYNPEILEKTILLKKNSVLFI